MMQRQVLRILVFSVVLAMVAADLPSLAGEAAEDRGLEQSNMIARSALPNAGIGSRWYYPWYDWCSLPEPEYPSEFFSFDSGSHPGCGYGERGYALTSTQANQYSTRGLSPAFTLGHAGWETSVKFFVNNTDIPGAECEGFAISHVSDLFHPLEARTDNPVGYNLGIHSFKHAIKLQFLVVEFDMLNNDPDPTSDLHPYGTDSVAVYIVEEDRRVKIDEVALAIDLNDGADHTVLIRSEYRFRIEDRESGGDYVIQVDGTEVLRIPDQLHHFSQYFGWASGLIVSSSTHPTAESQNVHILSSTQRSLDDIAESPEGVPVGFEADELEPYSVGSGPCRLGDVRTGLRRTSGGQSDVDRVMSGTYPTDLPLAAPDAMTDHDLYFSRDIISSSSVHLGMPVIREGVFVFDFEILIRGDWQGDTLGDRISFSWYANSVLQTVSYTLSNNATHLQSYPDVEGAGLHPARSGVSSIRPTSSLAQPFGFTDADVYRFQVVGPSNFTSSTDFVIQTFSVTIRVHTDNPGGLHGQILNIGRAQGWIEVPVIEYGECEDGLPLVVVVILVTLGFITVILIGVAIIIRSGVFGNVARGNFMYVEDKQAASAAAGAGGSGPSVSSSSRSGRSGRSNASEGRSLRSKSSSGSISKASSKANAPDDVASDLFRKMNELAGDGDSYKVMAAGTPIAAPGSGGGSAPAFVGMGMSANAITAGAGGTGASVASASTRGKGSVRSKGSGSGRRGAGGRPQRSGSAPRLRKASRGGRGGRTGGSGRSRKPSQTKGGMSIETTPISELGELSAPGSRTTLNSNMAPNL